VAFNRGTPKAPLCERGERRTSVKGSEIGAGSDTCFLTPSEERRGVCPERTEERKDEKRG